MASIAMLTTLATLFRKAALAAERPDAASMYAKVVASDAAKGTAQIQLTVMPSRTCFDLEGEVTGLLVGDYVEFHLGKNEVNWHDRDRHGKAAIKAILITP